jgi:hypothetical protein
MAEKEEKEGNKVKLTDKVAVRATAENPAVKRKLKKVGEIYEVHPAHVKFLIDSKRATQVEDK